MSDELKPCAHCGSDYEVEEWRHADWTDWRVMCGRCGASTDWYSSRDAAIAAWNTRADDAQIAANDNLPAEFDISADGHACNDTETVDSRERLEADICECINARSWGMNNDYMISCLVEWLDRQDAITRREFDGECEFCQSEVARLQERMDSLTAERDELQSIIDHMPKTEAECEACQEAHDRLMFNSGVDIGKLRDKVDRLTAERDDLQNLIDQERLAHLARVDELEFQRDGISEKADRLMDKCGKLQEAMNRAAGNWAKKDAELRVMTIAFNSVNDKLTEKQHVCDVQRDSFLKMERECAELRRMLADAAEAI